MSDPQEHGQPNSEPIQDGGAGTPESAEIPEDNNNTRSNEEHKGTADLEEQALELYEVIELQTFSERKAWIEEKIKFLDSLPPIEVFCGLDAVRESAEEVPGLPTREELRRWITEHDTIEKETVVFDTGELKKLRLLTKAATQRNLSPADTDLIELTLTTIYELDKLLHLLRDRSDNLELLAIRLDWEENRSAAWKDRRKILEDLETFITTRAQWSPSIYEAALKLDDSPDLTRRGSVTSLASVASDTSITTPAFSRSARFKLAELLSRDAAQFGARITSLCHGRVATAGRVLDKLIDHSRRPVPEELLDEQDRLEEKSLNNMENVGKFAMNLVMQWRKADEIYVETMKDQNAARELWEEIQTAKLHHPTARQSASFLSRVDTILKRLSVRGNPASKISPFPRPEHPLFPHQQEANQALALNLASDIANALDLAQKVEKAAKEYRESSEAVRHVEMIVNTANEISSSFTSIVQRLTHGVSDSDEDGTPPDLMSEACLDPARHSMFLALLPSMQSEASEIAGKADEIIKQSYLAIYALDSHNIDPAFESNATASIQRLGSLRDECRRIRELVSQRATRLKEARQIWTSMETKTKELQRVREQLAHQMERDCWKQELSGNAAPPTPESPAAELSPLAGSNSTLDADIQCIGEKIEVNVNSPLSTLTVTLEQPLRDHLLKRAQNLQNFHESLVRMNQLLKAIQHQGETMAKVRDEYNAFLLRIEDLKTRFSSLTEDVLSDRVSISDVKAEETAMNVDLNTIQDEVADFIDALSRRIPFVSRHTAVASNRAAFLRRPSMSKPVEELDDQTLHLPLDLVQLDAAVRADSNTYVMRLSGLLESTSKASTQLGLAQLAKDLDGALASTITDLHQAVENVKVLKASFGTAKGPTPPASLVQDLDSLLAQVDDSINNQRPLISRCFSPMRDLLRRMDGSSQTLEPSVRQSLYASRLRVVDDAETRFHSWSEELANLRNAIVASRIAELERLEELRRLEEQRKREEEIRNAAAEAERRRIEEEERLREEQRRAEEKRQAELLRQEQERLRKEAEEAERARLESERQEAEARRQREEEAKAAAARAQAEQERLAREEVEKARLLQEKLDVEAKLHETEVRLAEERHMQAERERLALQKSEEQRRKLEEEHRLLQLAGQQSLDNLARSEAERLRAAEEEKKQLQIELQSVKAEHKKVLDAQKDASNRAATANKRSSVMNGSHRYPMSQDDVFGVSVPFALQSPLTEDDLQLQSLIRGLRKRLRSININEVARPSKKSVDLPTKEQSEGLRRSFSLLLKDASELPDSASDATINAELRSLNAEIETSEELLVHIDKLVQLVAVIEQCDTALSDLLEHVDSYPLLPLAVSPLHISDETATPEEQLASRLNFTKATMNTMQSKYEAVANDRRAGAERTRLQQTFLELEDMANDRIGGKKSRPVSTVSSRPSSGRDSSASSVASRPSARKRNSYANLSVSSINVKGGKLAPPAKPPRRVVSGGDRSTSRLSSASTTRSVSGPLSASIIGSTFASRQRTASLSTSNGSATPTRQLGVTPSRMRTHTNSNRSLRTDSPNISECSSHSHAGPPPARSTSTSTSTWARAPRNSLSSILPRSATPQKKMGPAPRKKYIPDPKSKLDVAVGDVVNQLPVGINVEGVAETWKDQSGKYWIGNQEAKLCFCRILRSQTVMVRVGGGWTELSKFIKDHFAESFRILPESPPRVSSKPQEENWISSATLLEAAEIETPPPPPKTPEPTVPFVPAFSLSTPSGQSPRSIKSSGSPPTKGSPLTPLQFIRRAELDPNFLRPATPSKTPLRARNTPALTPSRPGVWRP